MIEDYFSVVNGYEWLLVIEAMRFFNMSHRKHGNGFTTTDDTDLHCIFSLRMERI
jgi:hypothetical protein